MPKLPSGRQVGLRGFTPDEIVRKVSEDKPNVSLLMLGGAIAALDNRDAVFPYVRILFARQSGGTCNTSLHEGSQPLPDGLELYDSEFTLADDHAKYDSDWPEADREEFQAFLNSERTNQYLDHLISQMARTSELYQNAMYDLIRKATEDVDPFCGDEQDYDDYDLLVALCIFADIEEPKENSKLDLWRRMNAVRRHWVAWIPVLGDVRADLENPGELSSMLRGNRSLEHADANREWVHKQNVVFANDLFDFYAPEALEAINIQACRIVTSIALSEPTR